MQLLRRGVQPETDSEFRGFTRQLGCTQSLGNKVKRTPSRSKSSKKIDDNDPKTYITCVLCGMRMRAMSVLHLNKYHKIGMFTYRKQYPNAQIQSESTRLKYAVANVLQDHKLRILKDLV